MTPIIAVSFEPNGSVVTSTSVPNRKPLNASTTKTTAIATLRGKLRSRRSKKKNLFRSFLPRNFNFLTLLTSLRERSPSFALSGVTGSWTSLAKILKFPKNLFTLMSGLRSLPVYIKSRFIRERNWLPLFNTNCLPGFLQILKPGKRCLGT